MGRSASNFQPTKMIKITATSSPTVISIVVLVADCLFPGEESNVMKVMVELDHRTR